MELQTEDLPSKQWQDPELCFSMAAVSQAFQLYPEAIRSLHSGVTCQNDRNTAIFTLTQGTTAAYSKILKAAKYDSVYHAVFYQLQQPLCFCWQIQILAFISFFSPRMLHIRAKSSIINNHKVIIKRARFVTCTRCLLSPVTDTAAATLLEYTSAVWDLHRLINLLKHNLWATGQQRRRFPFPFTGSPPTDLHRLIIYLKYDLWATGYQRMRFPFPFSGSLATREGDSHFLSVVLHT